MKINIKKLKDTAVIPTRGTANAAGYDLYACIESPVVIEPSTNKLIGTGLAIEAPNGYFGAITARSGLALKEGLRPANCIGICDPDYRGEYMVSMYNDSLEPRTIEPGERIAQLVFIPFASADFQVVEELSDTERGAGGFGHTGKKG